MQDWWCSNADPLFSRTKWLAEISHEAQTFGGWFHVSQDPALNKKTPLHRVGTFGFHLAAHKYLPGLTRVSWRLHTSEGWSSDQASLQNVHSPCQGALEFLCSPGLCRTPGNYMEQKQCGKRKLPSCSQSWVIDPMIASATLNVCSSTQEASWWLFSWSHQL
jgi:hypothetical protein